MDRVTNNLSASVPVFYKYTELSDGSLPQTQQAFTMQMNSYLLLRAFLFYLIRKELVVIPAEVVSHYQLRAAARSEEMINPSSPIPIHSPVEETSLLSAEQATAFSAILQATVDEQAGDVEYEKVVNQPAIAAGQKVEISRVNRYLSCSILIPATNAQPMMSQAVYLSIGRSHLSLLEMLKGSLKDAAVQIVFNLYELLDICIEDNSLRTLSILVGHCVL